MRPILNDKIVFKTEVSATLEQISSLLIYGFEGGCNHWLTVNAELIQQESEKFNGETNVRKQILQGGVLHCFDLEEPDEKLGELTLIQIVKALQAMANGEDLKGKKNDHLKWHFNNFITEDDDAETADVVIQIATMGEIVFG